LETKKTKIVYTRDKLNSEQTKIIDFCKDYFLENGFYKTTMDEIAAHLRMSKKTIYKYYSTKEDLVRETIIKFLEFHKENIGQIINENSNAVTKLNELFNYVGKMIAKINEKFIRDIQTQMPDLWKDIDAFRTKMMTINIGKIIEQGKKEGVFIDKTSAIITGVFISAVRGVINPEFIMANKFSIKMALEETIEIIINGITTETGKKAFQLLKSEQSNENN
jgi:AcrR family transcriptional regulator